MRHLTESNLSVTRCFFHGNEWRDGGVHFTTFALLCKCQRQAAFIQQISYRTQGTHLLYVTKYVN